MPLLKESISKSIIFLGFIDKGFESHKLMKIESGSSLTIGVLLNGLVLNKFQ